MWYLIIPPIIVVVSLSFVLWYLSRRGSDPLIAEKASRLIGEAQEQISFLRTKNFFLRILEKTAYRFKVVSLRIHNGFSDLTQTLKARRRRFQDRVIEKEALKEPKAPKQEKSLSRESFINRFSKRIEHAVGIGKPESKLPDPERSAPAEAVSENVVFYQPDPVETLERDQPPRVSYEPVVVPPLPSIRPMVSETIVRPEVVHERTPADISREEDLIARIAFNPKDFVAYEGLGDYYLEIGNVKDAKECYRQVLKLSPVHRIVRIKIRRLEKILSEKA
ncbi:MAG: tetratricopeptide repeat protein [Candidatus Moranbacteria bacterium]|nr:tetratricopeptide repeat protein [Candidatus Moranbacteria bacterium]